MLQLHTLTVKRALVFENSRLEPEYYHWINVLVMLPLVNPGEMNVILKVLCDLACITIMALAHSLLTNNGKCLNVQGSVFIAPGMKKQSTSSSPLETNSLGT